MNNERRASLEYICEMLDEASMELGCVRSDEEEAYENLPESLQHSKLGDSMQEAIDRMNDWQTRIDVIVDDIYRYT